MTSLVHEAFGLRYRVRPDVYDPSDDTFLLIEAVRGLPPGRFLEVGTGAGLVAIAAAQAGHRVTATDLSASALHLAGTNADLNDVEVERVRADLARGLRVAAFDVVAFNPPYLPTRPGEEVPGVLNAAFDGGPDGLATTARFLAQLSGRAKTVLVVASSLQPADTWAGLLTQFGWNTQTLCERRLPHERLKVLRLTATRKG